MNDHKKKLKDGRNHSKTKKGKDTKEQNERLISLENSVNQSKSRLSIIEKKVGEIIKNADDKLKEFKSLYEKKNELIIWEKGFFEKKKIDKNNTKMESKLVSLKDALSAFEKSERGYPWIIRGVNGKVVLEVVK